MSDFPYIRASAAEQLLTWKGVCKSIESGHRMRRADIDDIMFRHGDSTLLNRAAWVNGLGIGIKTATIFPGNVKRTPVVPAVHTIFTLLSDKTGEPVAMIDGDMVTKWKTAADSVLGACLLARPDSKTLLVIGAGVVAHSLVEAYSEIFTGLEQIIVWSRRHHKAEEFALKMQKNGFPIQAAEDLASTVAQADIISSATMSTEPVLKGEWVSPGTHIDLIGAFRPDMREADNDLILKSELFVDSRETAIHDIGELLIPLQNKLITEDDIRGDLYDLCNGAVGRTSNLAVTLYKNGGGAHLDVMTAKYIFDVFAAKSRE